MTGRRLLLLSNSRDPEGRFLEHPRDLLRDLLSGGVRRVLFVPYAGVTISAADYTSRVSAAFAPLGCEVESVTDSPDPVAAVRAAEAIAVGGGNTFHLLAGLYTAGLLEVIRERVAAGVPYIGWSAGSVVACPTIRTTNDMPITQPPSFDSLRLVPFQVNAHYTEFHPAGFQGETREMRIAEFVEVNRSVDVIGLPEGTTLEVNANRMVLHGQDAARLFRHGREKQLLQPGAELGHLLAQ
jgi:dipeptidase E